MNLTRQQLEDLYQNMDEVAQNSKHHEELAKKSIKITNRVIYIFTALGAILVALLLFNFIFFNKAITHSLNSMATINKQVIELRHTMDDITSSIKNMGSNVEYLQRISGSINKMTQATKQMSLSMQQLKQQTKRLSVQTHAISFHSSTINQNFSQINHSVGNISYSVHQIAKPIKQFIPIP